MQVQIKRQLKIELDQADITTAVGNFLAANGYQISDEDLARINFVKSPKDGLRAELNINEATEVADEPVEQPQVGTTENPAVEDAAIADLEAQPTATAVPEESAPADDPGAVEPSTVEDVAVEDAVDRAFTTAADEEEEEEVVPQGIPTSLFK